MRVLLIAASLAALAGPAVAADALTGKLVGIERRFYEAWKAKSTAAIQANVAADGVQLSPFGPLNKTALVMLAARTGANCTVKSFGLRDAQVRQSGPQAALLTYTLDQDADCGGHLPSPITAATLYTLRDGRWQVLFRTAMPLAPRPAHLTRPPPAPPPAPKRRS